MYGSVERPVIVTTGSTVVFINSLNTTTTVTSAFPIGLGVAVADITVGFTLSVIATGAAVASAFPIASVTPTTGSIVAPLTMVVPSPSVDEARVLIILFRVHSRYSWAASILPTNHANEREFL